MAFIHAALQPHARSFARSNGDALSTSPGDDVEGPRWFHHGGPLRVYLVTTARSDNLRGASGSRGAQAGERGTALPLVDGAAHVAAAIASAVQHRIGNQPSGFAHGRSVGVVDRAGQLDVT